MITYTVPPPDFQENQNKNDSVISKNDHGEYKYIQRILNTFIKKLFFTFEKQGHEISPRGCARVTIGIFALPLKKHTYLSMCWTSERGELTHAGQTCLVATFQLSLHCTYCRVSWMVPAAGS